MALLRRIQAISHGLAYRNQQATTEPLQQPPAKQAVDGAGAAGECRAQAEQRQRQQQCLAFAQPCGHPGAQRYHQGQAEHVQVAGPAQLRHRGVQFLAQRRVGGVEGEHVEQVEGETQQIDQGNFRAIGHGQFEGPKKGAV
ncbi:hypothetical protein D3C79_726060 [compost metagenome]